MTRWNRILFVIGLNILVTITKKTLTYGICFKTVIIIVSVVHPHKFLVVPDEIKFKVFSIFINVSLIFCSKILLVLIFNYMGMCVGSVVLIMWVPYLWRPEEDSLSPETGVIGNDEASNMGVGNQILVLWMNSVLNHCTWTIFLLFKAIVMIHPVLWKLYKNYSSHCSFLDPFCNIYHVYYLPILQY